MYVERPRTQAAYDRVGSIGNTKWNFCEHLDGRWTWHRVEPCAVFHSRARFATLEAAMDDAERHGLMPGKSRLGEVIRASDAAGALPQ